MITAAIIPARFQSSRLPGKPLLLLDGRPLVQVVYDKVKKTDLFDYVIVATDHKEIFNSILAGGGDVVMTSEKHVSGTDRVAEAVADIPADIIVNVQGDEPFITYDALAKLVEVMQDNETTVATLVAKIENKDDLHNDNVVKVVKNSINNALYFSRSEIPYRRDRRFEGDFYRHIGVYAFRKKALLDFVKMNEGYLERTEKLEQLRLLENGFNIRIVLTDYQGFGIDTQEDLMLAEKICKNNKNRLL